MKYRRRTYYTDAQKALMWERWKQRPAQAVPAKGHRRLELLTSQAQRNGETIEREAEEDARLPHAG
jgi:hypothetical protein